MGNYLETVADVYAAAAAAPDAGLCCTAAPRWHLPDLRIPECMLAMNYGCGSTVDPRDLRPGDTVLYVGVGGGMEALQFAYFTRRPGGVIAVDPVSAMRDKASANLAEAARLNAWFQADFVNLLAGDALNLPVASASVRVAAQNCLFNVFKADDLEQALAEIVRVLKPRGFFATSDPITPIALPEAFRADDIARAHCLSGCLSFDDYVAALVAAGFGRIEVRARVPYRYLSPAQNPALNTPVLLESVEVVAYKIPDGEDGPAIFTGRMAIYTGLGESWDDGAGTVFPRGIPVAVSDSAALRLARRPDVIVTPPTFQGRSGCC